MQIKSFEPSGFLGALVNTKKTVVFGPSDYPRIRITQIDNLGLGKGKEELLVERYDGPTGEWIEIEVLDYRRPRGR